MPKTPEIVAVTNVAARMMAMTKGDMNKRRELQGGENSGGGDRRCT
jgi:hypothetical protein